jgi:hypothetical protein
MNTIISTTLKRLTDTYHYTKKPFNNDQTAIVNKFLTDVKNKLDIDPKICYDILGWCGTVQSSITKKRQAAKKAVRNRKKSVAGSKKVKE